MRRSPARTEDDPPRCERSAFSLVSICRIRSRSCSSGLIRAFPGSAGWPRTRFISRLLFSATWNRSRGKIAHKSAVRFSLPLSFCHCRVLAAFRHEDGQRSFGSASGTDIPISFNCTNESRTPRWPPASRRISARGIRTSRWRAARRFPRNRSVLFSSRAGRVRRRARPDRFLSAEIQPAHARRLNLYNRASRPKQRVSRETRSRDLK